MVTLTTFKQIFMVIAIGLSLFVCTTTLSYAIAGDVILQNNYGDDGSKIDDPVQQTSDSGHIGNGSEIYPVKAGIDGVMPSMVSTDTAWIGPNNSVNVSYTIADAGNDVQLKIFDQDNNLVWTIDSGLQESGTHRIMWDGRIEQGLRVPDGNYTLKIYVYNSSNVGGYPDKLARQWSLFDQPKALAFDAHGNIYVAERGSGQVKKIYPNGSIISIGSGFEQPYYVSVDTLGNVYVADTGSIKVIYPNGTTGIYYSPFRGSAVIDQSGNIYDRDGVFQIYLNNTTRQLRKGGWLDTYTWPSCMSVDARGNLYVGEESGGNPDIFTSAVFKVDPNNPDHPEILFYDHEFTMPPTEQNNMTSAISIAPDTYDGRDRIYLLDSYGNRHPTIDVIDNGTRLYGNNSPYADYVFNYPQYVAVSPNGNLYVNDNGILLEYIETSGYPVVSDPLSIVADSVAPVTGFNLSYVNGTSACNAIVALNATDTGSGVNSTLYRLDNGQWTQYHGLLNITETGDHIISYYSMDNAGNGENISSSVFNASPAGPGHITRIIVDPRPGTGMFTNITTALAYAQPGDTVIVDSGSYRERLVVNKAINLTGMDTGSGMPVVDGYGGMAIYIPANGVSIHGFNVTNGSTGIYVCSNVSVTGNNVNNNSGTGIFLFGSGNDVSGNVAKDNNVGIYLYRSGGNSISGNDAGGNRLIGIYLLYSSPDNFLSGNTANGDHYGIFSYSSGYNSLAENTANGCYYGIYLYNSSDNTIDGNAVNNSNAGIYMHGYRNKLSENTANGNIVGVCISVNSSDNIACENTVTGNGYGIYVFGSSDNRIRSNFIARNKVNAYLKGGVNYWNSTAEQAYTYNGQQYVNYTGNYWGDHQGTDGNADGIADTPYVINAGNIDYYPMILKAQDHTVKSLKVYVTNMQDNNVSVIDPSTNTVSDTITVGMSPLGIAVNPDRTTVYVTNQDNDNVSVIDTSINAVLADIPITPGGCSPTGVAFSPDGTKAYVLNSMYDTIMVIDTATNTISTTISSGPDPIHVAFSPDGSLAYVTNNGYPPEVPGNVTVINTTTNTVISTIPVDRAYGLAVSPNGEKIYVTIYGEKSNLSVIDTSTNTMMANITVDSYPFEVAVSPDGTKLYVTTNINTVVVIDTFTNAAIATIPVGMDPFQIRLSPDGTRAYVANYGSDTVSVIDTANETVIATIPVGNGPRGVAIG